MSKVLPKRPRKKTAQKPEQEKNSAPVVNYYCGVRQMNGKLCRAPVLLPGKCDLHKNMPGTTHGFYAQTLTEDERLEYDQISLGEVDNEIRLARIQLRRVLKKQKLDDSILQKIREVDETSDTRGSTLVVTRELIDYPTIVNKFLNQIGRLESLKAQIQHMVIAVHDDGVHGFRSRLAEMEQQDEGIL